MSSIQIVIIKLANQSFGIPITQVQEIIKVPQITSIPCADYYLQGIINVRGRVLPIISLRKRLGHPDVAMGENSRVVIVENSFSTTGLVVDEVVSIKILKDEDIEKDIERAGVNEQLITGIGKVSGDMVLILDIEPIISELAESSIAT